MLKWGISRKAMDDRTPHTTPVMHQADGGSASGGVHTYYHDNAVKSGAITEVQTGIGPSDEPKKTPRRKRKLVPTPGTTSLLSATIDTARLVPAQA